MTREGRKEMLPVEVWREEDGNIFIAQDFGTGEGEHKIMLHPDQVDLLIQWLSEAKAKLRQD